MSSDNERIANAIAPHLGGGHVQHDSKGVWEWRGALCGLKTRVRVEDLYCRVQVETHNPLGTFQLVWGPKLVPDPGAVDDDAFDASDEVRVWVGRCVAIECFALELEQQIAGFRSFPPQATGYLIEGMQRDRVRVLGVERNEFLGFVEKENPDVVGATVRFTQLLAWTGAQLALVAPAAQQYIVAGAARAAAPNAHLRCRYCKAHFLVSQAGTCPSCGAPAG